MNQKAQQITTDDLHQLEKRFERKFSTKQDLLLTESNLKSEITALEDRLNNKFDEKFNDIMTALVDVMGQLQDMRENNAIGTHQIRKLRDTSVDHEKRIAKLEKTYRSS